MTGVWRKVKRSQVEPGLRTAIWLSGATTIWLGLVLTKVIFPPERSSLAFALLILGFFPVFWLLSFGFWISGLSIGLMAGRFWSPVLTADPPPNPSFDDSQSFRIAPQPRYPAFAFARRQSGWVRLSMRISPDERIESFRIEDQTPRNVFEAAVVACLYAARVARPPDVEGIWETETLVTFITPAKDGEMQDWVKSRFEMLKAGIVDSAQKDKGL